MEFDAFTWIQDGLWEELEKQGFRAPQPLEDTAGQAEYSQLLFCLYYPEYCLEDTEYGVGVDISKAADRIQLVNSETGQVLLDDLEVGQAYSPEQ